MRFDFCNSPSISKNRTMATPHVFLPLHSTIALKPTLQRSTFAPVITGELGFLSRLDVYETVKPYGMRYQAPQGISQTNVVGHKLSLPVANAWLHNMALEDCGFGLVPFSTSMDYTDFNNSMMIKNTYCAEIAEVVKHNFGPEHVRVMDYSVC